MRSGSSVIENVGLTDVNITAIRPDGSSATLFSIGGLAGLLTGTVRTSYATGTITVTAGNAYIVTSAGGLIGQVGRPLGDVVASGQLDASWAAVNVSVTSTSTAGTDPDSAGGLVGWLTSRSSAPSAVSTSYARGGQPSSGRTGSMVGGLIGRVEGPRTTVTASYWDTVTSTLSSGGGGTGQTTTALQTPTGYTGIYAAWNTDVDGDGNADDPWDFGTGSQYPVLKYASHDFAAQGRPFDYDADNDGLIDITTLAQLDAIRHDLNGDGDPAGATGAAAFRKAFPHRVRSAAGRMGCQPTDHDSNTGTPDRATCTGYELMADLDFDTNGDGNVNASDDYPNWAPIGGITHASWAAVNASDYTATFEGNGRGISNLHINRAIDNNAEFNLVGLFAGVSGAIRNVDLLNPQVSITRSGTSGSVNASKHTTVGGLVGYLLPGSRVDDSRIVGGAVTFTQGAGAISRSYIGLSGGTSLWRREPRRNHRQLRRLRGDRQCPAVC